MIVQDGKKGFISDGEVIFLFLFSPLSVKINTLKILSGK